MARRSADVGSPMLLTLPTGGEWQDTGEGGMAFYLLVATLVYPHDRQTCMAGHLVWPLQDCVIGADTDTPPDANTEVDSNWQEDSVVDAALLIGSTGRSWWSEDRGEYFRAGVADLTEQGRAVWDTIAGIYGATPSIFTLLDT